MEVTTIYGLRFSLEQNLSNLFLPERPLEDLVDRLRGGGEVGREERIHLIPARSDIWREIQISPISQTTVVIQNVPKLPT